MITREELFFLYLGTVKKTRKKLLGGLKKIVHRNDATVDGAGAAQGKSRSWSAEN